MGSDLQTVILASSVLYELIGPGCAKLALYLSKSYSTKLEDVVVVEELTETGEKKTDVQLLIERIQKIQKELPALDSDMSEEEALLPRRQRSSWPRHRRSADFSISGGKSI